MIIQYSRDRCGSPTLISFIHPLEMPSKSLSELVPPVGTEGQPGSADKAQSSTSFPLEQGMSISLWLETVRGNPLLDHRSTPDLPSTADVVIIGSGVSALGSAVESRLTRRYPAPWLRSRCCRAPRHPNQSSFSKRESCAPARRGEMLVTASRTCGGDTASTPRSLGQSRLSRWARVASKFGPD